MNAADRISVVIPALNEAHHLRATLKRLPREDGLEVIVVDGGSHDATLAVAQERADLAIAASVAGRASQMNTGARAATGGILLFLHADTHLPVDFTAWIRQTLARPQTVAGAFRLAVASDALALRWVEFGVRLRSRWLGLPYGDQGIFLRRSTFERVGGFPEQPLMEDFELMRRLHPLGRIQIVPSAASTSARRWERLGVWQTTALNQAIVMGYLLGFSPQRLADLYHRTRRNRSEKCLDKAECLDKV